jgi:DNA-binding transcriptional ArsR family regulator
MQMSDGSEGAGVVGLDVCSAKLIDPERVASVRERLVDLEEAGRLAEQFKLLADPTRTRLLYALLEAGELCVCDLAETIGVPESSVSHALRLLRTAGIVRNRRDGRMIYYSLDDAHVRLLLDLSLEHLRHEGGRR